MKTINNIGTYDPKCKKPYKRIQCGKVMWWISYYLPNGKRMLRPVHKDHKEAKKLVKDKERQLIRGIFDAKDQKKLEGFYTSLHSKGRLTIDDGLSIYFEATESRKQAKTHYNDVKSISSHFSFFKNDGKQFLDEVRPFDVHKFIRRFNKEGKSESTIKNAVTGIRKVYNCLIDELKIPSLENPVPPKIKLPKKGGLVRKEIPTDEEVRAIFSELDQNDKLYLQGNFHSSSISPLKAITHFIILTGARRSEVLHAEWTDFDWENGVWKIRIKPDCPTQYGLGWAPKWGMERDIILCTPAIKLLQSLDTVKSVGKVNIRNDSFQIVDQKYYPANFVFPKKEIQKLDDGTVITRFTRSDSFKTAWKSLLKRAGLKGIQVKDLRTCFNHKLRSSYGFSSKEAGDYIGHDPKVNDLYYTPVIQDVIRQKMDGVTLENLFGIQEGKIKTVT